MPGQRVPGAAAIATVLGSIAAIQAGRAATERDRALTAEAQAEAETARAELAADVARAGRQAAEHMAVPDGSADPSRLAP